MEMLKASKVTKRITGLVTSMTVVTAVDVVEAFLADCCTNLVSRLSLCISPLFGVIGFIDFVFVACAFIHFPVPPSSPRGC